MGGEKTLDLTCFNRGTFFGTIRLRTLADWANDYWSKGYRLARVKMYAPEYHDLIHEIEQDNRLVKESINHINTIDLGFGEVEVICVK